MEWMSSLRLNVNLRKITFNARRAVDLCRRLGLEVMGVTKGTAGHPLVAKAMLDGGIQTLGDSRLDNIARMRNAGIDAPVVLIRSPGPSETARTVDLADASLNGSLEIISALADVSTSKAKRHGVFLTVDLNTGREGLPVHEVPEACRRIVAMPGVELWGLAAYFHFRSEKSFQVDRLEKLATLAATIKRQYGIPLRVISGGSTNVFRTLVLDNNPVPGITQLRIGTAVLLGLAASIGPEPIEGFHQDAFVLDAEVIEIKGKENLTAILSLGKLDTDRDFLFPSDTRMKVIDATSDHLLLQIGDAEEIRVGSRVTFLLGYPALSRLMVSPYVNIEWR
jgi:ornithine racemase